MERYIINKELGSGSFGKVFLVEAKSTGIQYVAKQIDLSRMVQRNKKAAEKEIQILAKLQHPNIVRYKEAYGDNNILTIIMELCDMGDLHKLIQDTRQRNDRFSEGQVMEYFVQICQALNYIHQQRILHRDLKTKNIFLKRGNMVKLGDFGVAKVLENSFELAQTCVGSPFYISPEICENQAYDKKSDMWALGCVLFEVTTLKYAFTARNMKALITKITNCDHTPLPGNVSPNIRHLIKRLLSKNPKQRPTAQEILSWPFVRTAKVKSERKPRRSSSGGDLKGRTLLPISRSCLNLTVSDVTEPESKYLKGQRSRSNTRKSDLNQAKDTHPKFYKAEKANNTDYVLKKKLPESDSLYYSIIAKGRESEDAISIFRNVFPKEGNVDEKNSQEVQPGCEGDRRKWGTKTEDREQLVTLLSKNQLVETFSDCDYTQTMDTVKDLPQLHQKTIDEILFTHTADLSHIAALQPEQLHVTTNQLRDATFVIEICPSFHEQLEQRRINLERTLGLESFLKAYKWLEQKLCVNEGFCPTYEDSKELSMPMDKIKEICQLVKDDLKS